MLSVIRDGFQITFASTSPTTATGKPVVFFDHKQEQLLSQVISSFLDKCAIELHLRHPEEDRRIMASLQPQGPEPVCSMSNIQDENNQRHISSYTTARLDDIYRPFGCFPSHISSSLLSTFSPFCMERGLLPVQNNSLCPLRGPLPVHKTH
ncbi:hypothetical protein A0J61_10391 [Choanephora cucurbitarum]|uniref:Uncharacterized protein n=1 Tax=Choanephora cucurbitarum TaxID=101091 RepID=A0A1C7MYS8_9FUNG|nr:hypothetical protein A0J61_10391 [Choanephora cucurbitarum]